MKNIMLLFLIVLFSMACRKRSSKFSFSGVWEIQKVEQVSFANDSQSIDNTFKSDTLGWFALQNFESLNYTGKMQINFISLSGLFTDYNAEWNMDEHNSDRILINGNFYTRTRMLGGEKWTWIASTNSGANYTRETIYVKHK